MRQITKDEWYQYEWHDVTTVSNFSDNKVVFIRGIENVDPPDDGYVYIDRTRYGDQKRRWIPAMTDD
jgi:hypothetical protein